MKGRPVVLALLAASLSMPTALHAQSLGDIAKKAQEQRDKAKAEAEKAKTEGEKAGQPAAKPLSKTYTNKDLTDTPPAEKPASEAAPSKSTSSETKKSADKADSTADKSSEIGKAVVKDEAYWRGRWTPLHEKLGEDLQKALSLRGRIYDLTVELIGIGPLNARRGGVETERQRLITEAEAVDNMIAKDKAALAAVEEEGRRASALPGWFR
jgi:hypothetical protein